MVAMNERPKRKPVRSIRWNDSPDKTISETHKLNQRNAWVADRINVAGDRVSWTKMTEQERKQYILTFVILSRIDAEQGLVGMDLLATNSPCSYTAAVFRYEGGIEVVHSEAYNRQLAQFISTKEEMEFVDWADNSSEVNDVIGYLIQRMIDVQDEENPEVAWLLQLAFSTILESYLFYLLFYYPLYMANVKSRMTRCAEVVRLILRDESVHGAFSGYTFKKYMKFETEETQDYIKSKIEEFMGELYSRVERMLKFVYEEDEIIQDIQKFANYNFNRTLQNLGYDEVFTGDDVKFHPSLESEVKNGTDVTHDIFSMTGNVYFMMSAVDYTDENRKNVERNIEKRHAVLLPKRRC